MTSMSVDHNDIVYTQVICLINIIIYFSDLHSFSDGLHKLLKNYSGTINKPCTLSSQIFEYKLIYFGRSMCGKYYNLYLSLHNKFIFNDE